MKSVRWIKDRRENIAVVCFMLVFFVVVAFCC